MPTLGLQYSRFKDGSYTETGASIQNLSSARKASYNLDAVIGGKLNKAYLTNNNYTITPELSAFAHINMKNKAATIRMSSAAFTNPVTIKGEKASKAWYSVGPALNIVKNRTEYNLSYEAQFDKKYIGHQAMRKIRVNF